MWAKFSQGEMDRRWRLARDLMAEHDLEALIVFGNSGVNRHNEANVFWLSNWLDMHHCYLLAPRNPSYEPVLLVGLVNHVPSAREIAQVPVVVWGGYNPAETLAQHLRRYGITRGRVGLVGVNHTFRMGMPYQHYEGLKAAFPDLTFVDVTRAFAALRLIKSEEEIAWLRRAAAMTDAAVAALREEVRPGMPEYMLVAIAERAIHAEGGLPHICYVRTMPMDAPTGCVPSQNPGERPIAEGDVILTEISGSFWGYSGQVQYPLFVGRPPTPPWQQLFDAAREAYERVVAVLRPGATIGDVIDAASVIGKAGYTIVDDLLHGFGVDIMPPIVDRSCVAYWQDADRPLPQEPVFQRHMAVVVQPNPVTPDERMGLQLGGLVVITDQGAEPLQQVPGEPPVI